MRPSDYARRGLISTILLGSILGCEAPDSVGAPPPRLEVAATEPCPAADCSAFAAAAALYASGLTTLANATMSVSSWLAGDVFLGVSNGQYKVFDNGGTFKETVSQGLGGFTTGCAFNPALDKLYTTNFSAAQVIVFDDAPPHAVTQTISAPGLGGTESVVFDAAGNIYAGNAGGTLRIQKFGPTGTFIASYAAATENRGTDWLDLASDQKTMYYTSEGGRILRFDVQANAQLTDFASIGGVSYALRLLPPGDGSGGLLVANTVTVKRLNGSGAVVQSYDAPGEDSWFSLNLDPNGTSFWAGNFGSSRYYRFNIATGAIELGPITASTANTLFGICLKGEPTASVPQNQPPTLHPIDAKTVNEGSTVTFTAVGSDPDAGQTVTYSLVSPPAGATINATTGAFSWTPTDDNPTATLSDVYTVTVRVTDNASTPASTDQNVQITVYNVAPDIGAFTTFPTAPVAVGTSITLTAPFTDPGSGDTFTGSIDWDDGAVTAPVITPFASISGSHTYTAPGVYAVKFSLSDDDGGSDVALFQYVVAYDPNGGFVTGGGWIDSPAGAYLPNSELTGKATFGFVSKYKKGATAPDGETEFQFQTAGLNFHSTAYEWLVISGPKAQYKGSGTVNGVDGYGFLLTANDGQVSGGGGTDKFRIKIWLTATGVVVYDNQNGDSDTGPATTVLGGGSIVIHSK